VAASSVQAGPPKLLSQLFGGPPSGAGSRHRYQSRFGPCSEDRLCANQACWSEVWLGTKSRMIFSPRAWASRTSSSKFASVPKRASMPL
jgi:hypothetical protein